MIATTKVFLLSIPEVKRYFSSDRERRCIPTAYAKQQGVHINDSGTCIWWLRLPGKGQSGASDVDFGGVVNDHVISGLSGPFGVRPALWINL